MSPEKLELTLKISIKVHETLKEGESSTFEMKKRLLAFSAAMFSAWNDKFGTNIETPYEALSNKMNEWWVSIENGEIEVFCFNWAGLLVDIMEELKKSLSIMKLKDSLIALKNMLEGASKNDKENDGTDNIYKMYT